MFLGVLIGPAVLVCLNLCELGLAGFGLNSYFQLDLGFVCLGMVLLGLRNTKSNKYQQQHIKTKQLFNVSVRLCVSVCVCVCLCVVACWSHMLVPYGVRVVACCCLCIRASFHSITDPFQLFYCVQPTDSYRDLALLRQLFCCVQAASFKQQTHH